ncbi:hypothetical protein C8F04DRAFT_1193580 [Mycena alexandri]|uniref:Uncharacterized protein n=1 Tax=Mycena alexandri TaxID=1745969 RepID=A0AAD6S9V2_9AGAR|nr:hypothetical protein C8F04DRAFT_1193580 [Mycena alexandri]
MKGPPRLTSNTSSRAFEQSEDGSAIYGGVFEQADSPCFAPAISRPLSRSSPLVPDLVNSFPARRRSFQATPFQAQCYHIETGDSTLGIYVFPTRAEAEYMLNSNTL